MAELPDVDSIDTLIEQKVLQRKLLSIPEKERRRYIRNEKRKAEDLRTFVNQLPSMNRRRQLLASDIHIAKMENLDFLTSKANKNRQSIESLDSEIKNLLNEKRMMQMNFAEGDVVELPDVGSIEPLTETEARKSFGTPLQRFLKIDPISVERDPVKRGIVSIGSNIRDMLLPEFGLEQAVKEGDPVQMAISAFDYVIANPAVALLTKGSKSILQLAKDLQKMNPEDAAKAKESVNRLIQREKDQLDYELGYLDDQGYRLPGYETAKKRLEILEENESIINKAKGKNIVIGEELNPVELQTGFNTLQEYMEYIARNPGSIPFSPALKKQIIKYIKDNPQKVESIALRKKLQRTDLDDAIDSLD